MRENKTPQFYKAVPKLPHLLKIKASGVVVRCVAFNEATQEFDVEDSDGKSFTIPYITTSNNVTPQEEMKFLKKNH